MNYQDRSKAYIEALALCAITLEEVIAWSDSIILKENEPRIEFIELSMSKSVNDAVTQLNKLAINADEEKSYKYLFGLLYVALKNGSADYHDVSRKLFYWSLYDTDLDEYMDLSYFWDAIDLADEGHVGDPKEVREEFLEYLNKHKI